MQKFMPIVTGVLAVALIAVSAYAFMSIASLNTDVASAQAQLADTKTELTDTFKLELEDTDSRDRRHP